MMEPIMMSFLDLSAASEEECRLIKEILSDTSVVNIDHNTPPKAATETRRSNASNTNATKVSTSINTVTSSTDAAINSNSTIDTTLSDDRSLTLHTSSSVPTDGNATNNVANFASKSNSDVPFKHSKLSQQHQHNILPQHHRYNSSSHHNQQLKTAHHQYQTIDPSSINGKNISNHQNDHVHRHHSSASPSVSPLYLSQQNHQVNNVIVNNAIINNISNDHSASSISNISSSSSSGGSCNTNGITETNSNNTATIQASGGNHIGAHFQQQPHLQRVPPGYPLQPPPPPHVTHAAFGPPPPTHLYGGPPLFHSIPYVLSYNLPPYVPYMMSNPGSVVPTTTEVRHPIPPHSSHPTNIKSASSSSHNPHSRSHMNHLHHNAHHSSHHNHNHNHLQSQQLQPRPGPHHSHPRPQIKSQPIHQQQIHLPHPQKSQQHGLHSQKSQINQQSSQIQANSSISQQLPQMMNQQPLHHPHQPAQQTQQLLSQDSSVQSNLKTEEKQSSKQDQEEVQQTSQHQSEESQESPISSHQPNSRAEVPANDVNHTEKPTEYEEKSLTDITEQQNATGDLSQKSNSVSWGSASSKSWADLFKRGVNPSDSTIDEETAGDPSFAPSNIHENGYSRPNDEKVFESTRKSNNVSSSMQEHQKSISAKRALDRMAHRLANKLKNINLKHSLPYLKQRGFVNRGNFCYINAVLQALIGCPPFYNLIREVGDLRIMRRDNSCTPIIDSFAELFTHYPPTEPPKNRSDDAKSDMTCLLAPNIEPKCVYKVLGHIKLECLKGAQEDAQEFLSKVLNGLHEEMINLSDLAHDSKIQNGLSSDSEDVADDIADDGNLWREVGHKNRSLPIRTSKMVNTPIQEIFGGSLFSIRVAGKDRCGYRSPFIDLQLDITGDSIKNVLDAIKSFTATEIIEDFYCTKTKQKVDAQRRTLIDHLPPILILHLKQFIYSPDHGLKKLIKRIDYPIDLELPDSCLHERHSNDKSSRSYKLLAVIYHDGEEATKGHYICDVFHIGSSQWVRCDDGTLSVTQSPYIEDPTYKLTPYILLYRRLNTIRASINNNNNNQDNKKKV